MKFIEFLLLKESAPEEYKVINRPMTRPPGATWVSLEERDAKKAEEKFLAGRMNLKNFLKKQQIGFRVIIDGKEYVRSMDGLFVKDTYPISGFQGSQIGQRELYSKYALQKYTSYLKKKPTNQTEPLEVYGTPDNYLVRDGHHRMQAYKNAKRTEVPVWLKFD